MYQDNGMNEFATVCNVTFRGMELAGSFTKDTAKAFLRMVTFLMTAKLWASNKMRDYEYGKAGKKRKKIMKDKYQGEVLHGKINSVRGILEKQTEGKQLTEEQLSRMPDEHWIKERFDKLSKVYGLEYCILSGNAEKKQDAGVIIQYPKIQEGIYNEVFAKLQSEVKMECERVFHKIEQEKQQTAELQKKQEIAQRKQDMEQCKSEIVKKKEEIKAAKQQLQGNRKSGDKVGQEMYGERIAVLTMELEELKKELPKLTELYNQTKKEKGENEVEILTEESKTALQEEIITPITLPKYLEESRLLTVSEEEFEERMQQMFPDEYEAVKDELERSKDEKVKAEEKWMKEKKEFVRRINQLKQQAMENAIKNGEIIEFEIDSPLLTVLEEDCDERVQQMFPDEYAAVKEAFEKSKDEKIKAEEKWMKEKKEFINQLNQQTRENARKNGETIEFEIDANKYAKKSGNKAIFGHPEYPGILMTVSADDVCGLVQKENNKIIFSLYKNAAISFSIPVLDGMTGKPKTNEDDTPVFVKKQMPYEEFQHHIEEIGETASIAMWKKEQDIKLQSLDKTMIEPIKRGIANAKK